jgi:ribonuclease HI
MELTAAIEGLRRLKERCTIEIVTDSQYLKNGMMQWIQGWKRNGWKTSAKQPVLNKELWESLDELVSRHDVRWTWTKGHASHEDNNRCDELANLAARDQTHGDVR